MDQLNLEDNLKYGQPLVYCERQSCSYCCNGLCSHLCITINKNGVCIGFTKEVEEKDLL